MEITTNTYTWNNYQSYYQFYQNNHDSETSPALLLIHPVGVGLSGFFWERFAQAWFNQGQTLPLYVPDLLGCGKSAMPHVAYYPLDWAEQLEEFITTVIKKPVIVVAQGALVPVAIKLVELSNKYLQGLILSGPPAWRVMTEPRSFSRQRLSWNIFDSLVGNLFYRYARRKEFLNNFSVKQLFASSEAVDEYWLNSLMEGASNLESRHAVFSFLAGFWRENYSEAIATINLPTLVVFGEKASSISRNGFSENPEQRLSLYLQHLPKGVGKIIPGRNVLPYESTNEFISVVVEFINNLG
jgi:pimeloyl-ACP methyl ester carboxylesterase